MGLFTPIMIIIKKFRSKPDCLAGRGIMIRSLMDEAPNWGPFLMKRPGALTMENVYRYELTLDIQIGIIGICSIVISSHLVAPLDLPLWVMLVAQK